MPLFRISWPSHGCSFSQTEFEVTKFFPPLLRPPSASASLKVSIRWTRVAKQLLVAFEAVRLEKDSWNSQLVFLLCSTLIIHKLQMDSTDPELYKKENDLYQSVPSNKNMKDHDKTQRHQTIYIYFETCWWIEFKGVSSAVLFVFMTRNCKLLETSGGLDLSCTKLHTQNQGNPKETRRKPEGNFNWFNSEQIKINR